MRSLYSALGLAPGADDVQIKAAFRDLAKKSHPDVTASDADSAERFKEIHQAYRLLRDPHTRAVLTHVAAEARAATSRRWLMSMATMAAAFILTVGGGLLFLVWQPDPRPDPLVATPTEAKAPAARQEQPAETRAKAAQTVAIPVAEEGVEKRARSRQATVSAAQLDTQTDAVPTVKPQAKQEAWIAYRNTRFGFSLKYPAHVFAPVTGEHDGEVLFVSHDGRARLRVSGRPFSRAITLQVYRRRLIAERYGGAAFDRTTHRKTWFALAGNLGDKKFYERVVCSCDGRALHTWQLTYPPDQRAFYEPIVEEIRRSYRRQGEDAEGHCRRSQA